MFRYLYFLLGTVAFLCNGRAVAENSASVRMGFLLNFTRYVEWPATTLKPEAVLHICLAPGDTHMASLAGEFSKQSIQGRLIQIKQISRPADANTCHVLYLPAETPEATLADWLRTARQVGALTVGDLPDMVEAGGMIGLVPVDGRYRFDINLGVARQADLRLGSQLLKLARTVK
jgi:hypothetical protein